MPHEVSTKKFSVDLSGQVALVTGALARHRQSHCHCTGTMRCKSRLRRP